jgi:hypothetical protein
MSVGYSLRVFRKPDEIKYVKDEVHITRLLPLLNAYRTFSFNAKSVGHFVIVDRRAKPVNYYYG